MELHQEFIADSSVPAILMHRVHLRVLRERQTTRRVGHETIRLKTRRDENVSPARFEGACAALQPNPVYRCYISRPSVKLLFLSPQYPCIGQQAVERMTSQVDHNGLRPGGNRSLIVIADDRPLFRSALVQMLDSPPDLEVVGQAINGREAVDLCRRLCPDLVLMDITMPVMDGVEATRTIKREFPHTIVMVLTASAEPNELLRALEAGAAGYVLKEADPTEVIEAVRQVVGEYFLTREVATRLLMRLMKEEPREDEISRSSEGFLGSLSPRELDVLRLIARGYANQQIARELFLSLSTVKKHVRRVISKLGVSDRTQAAVRAVELGTLAEHDKG